MGTKFGDQALVPHGVEGLGEVEETDAGDLPLVLGLSFSWAPRKA